MIDLYAFNCLPRDTRAELVWQHGRFLAMRQEMSCSVILYHMERFFAEVWYSPDDNQIALVHGFKSRALLEPYLESIGLGTLLGE